MNKGFEEDEHTPHGMSMQDEKGGGKKKKSSNHHHHLHKMHKLLKHPEKLHQDILRSLNLHSILHEGLRIDYK